MNFGNCSFLNTPLDLSIHTNNDILEILSPERKKRIKKFKKQEDVTRSVLSEVLLRYALISDFGLQNCEINCDGSLVNEKTFRFFPLDDYHYCAVCLERENEILQKVFIKESELIRQVNVLLNKSFQSL